MADPVQLAIKAAMTLAKDLAAGRITPADLDDAAAVEVHGVFSTVVGPEDPAWPTQVDVARQVLAAGGVPADELAEWLTVARATEPEVAPQRGASWIETALATDDEGIDDA